MGILQRHLGIQPYSVIRSNFSDLPRQARDAAIIGGSFYVGGGKVRAGKVAVKTGQAGLKKAIPGGYFQFQRRVNADDLLDSAMLINRGLTLKKQGRYLQAFGLGYSQFRNSF
jgi:hypothetical protein